MQTDPRQIAAAAYELRRGGVVAFPTETVYGLGAVATDETAVEQVFRIKGRPKNNPLIVHVSGVGMARQVADVWPVHAGALADAFWPGPLSIVVQRDHTVPDIVTAGGPTVCLRCPDHPVARALINAAGSPLVGPSANRSRGVSPTTAEHVRQSFPGLTVLDGGPCRVGIESTVVRIAHGAIEVLRPGVIGADELASATGMTVTTAGAVASDGPLESPGLMSRHYAPTTPARMVARDKAAGLAEAAVLSQAKVQGAALVIEMPASAPEYAAALYNALRQADAARCAEIIIIEPQGPGPAAVWDAIADRLRRACGRQQVTP